MQPPSNQRKSHLLPQVASIIEGLAALTPGMDATKGRRKIPPQQVSLKNTHVDGLFIVILTG